MVKTNGTFFGVVTTPVVVVVFLKAFRRSFGYQGYDPQPYLCVSSPKHFLITLLLFNSCFVKLATYIQIFRTSGSVCCSFSNPRPVLGHIKAGIHNAAGHHDMAHQALERANHSTDYTPVLGHVKAVVHQAAGDHERAQSTLVKVNSVTQMKMLNAYGFESCPAQEIFYSPIGSFVCGL